MTNKTKMMLIFLMIAIGIVALILLAKAKGPPPNDAVQEMSAREVVGSTIEDRLTYQGIDISNARITRIDDVDSLKQEYSGIFKDAKNGDYLVESPSAVIVYDFEQDAIVARFDVIRMEIG